MVKQKVHDDDDDDDNNINNNYYYYFYVLSAIQRRFLYLVTGFHLPVY
jgi:hypothetical protein